MEIADVKRVADELKTAFEEYKKTNDQRIEALQKKGEVDPLIEEKLAKIDQDINTLQGQITSAKRLPAPGGSDAENPDAKAHKTAFGQFLRKGIEGDLRTIEQKAMSVGSDPTGGYWVPADTTGRIVKRVYETSLIRQYANASTISTDKLKGPYDLEEAGSGWVGETETRSETTTPKTGEWEIPVHEQYAEPKATQTLLDDAAYDVEGFLAGKVADRFARQENYAFILGDGIKRPRGLFTYTTAATTDSSRAWGTFEHIKTGVAGGWAASAPADILFDVTYALKAAYRQGAVWTMPRLLVAEIRKFKDENGQYLWQPGLAAGQPQTILSYPVAEMEDIPAKAADSLSIGFGDLRETYQIVDRTGIRVLRDPLTEKPWVKFYTTKRVGGDVVNFESFKFIKFSA